MVTPLCLQASEAVAALERDVEYTLVFYQLDAVAQEWIRTTSLLERTNRELRRTFRQAVTFGNVTGANAAVYLQVQRPPCLLDHSQLVGRFPCSVFFLR